MYKYRKYKIEIKLKTKDFSALIPKLDFKLKTLNEK
jgi:hypothetical protein